jgi:hypothetical protein
MVVSVQGNDKVYDGNTAATLSLKGNPALAGDVRLVAAGGATAVFNDKNVASGIGITYSGYSLGGADAGLFTLPVFYCPTVQGITSGNITPAPLTLTALDATKVYGTTFTPAGTAFTKTAMVGSETVTSVAETSTGSAPGANATGSGYPIVITPGSATGTFTPTNYAITYINGSLKVTPVVPPVVVPPVVEPPVVEPPVVEPPVVEPPDLPSFETPQGPVPPGRIYEGPPAKPGNPLTPWAPSVVPPETPPQLLTLVPPPMPTPVAHQEPVVELPSVVEQPAAVIPPPELESPEPPPAIYAAPNRPRKQDRN